MMSLTTFREYRQKQKVLAGAARSLVKNPDWLEVEKEIRKDITVLYSRLGNASVEEVEKLQMQIGARVEFFKNVYRLAGLEWGWTGFKTIEEREYIEDEEILKEEFEHAIDKSAMGIARGG